MDQKNGNVVDFPVHQIKVKRKPANEPSRSALRRTYAAASLFSVIFLVVILNQQLMPEASDPSVQGRGIASIGSVSGHHDLNYQRDLAKKLSEKPISDVSARGAKPTELEQLIFGTLSGQYLVGFDDHRKVTSISLSEHRQGKSLSDLAGFVLEMRGFLPVEFARLQQIDSADKGQQRFALIGADNTKVGVVALQLDSDQRLLSLNFQN